MKRYAIVLLTLLLAAGLVAAQDGTPGAKLDQAFASLKEKIADKILLYNQNIIGKDEENLALIKELDAGLLPKIAKLLKQVKQEQPDYDTSEIEDALSKITQARTNKADQFLRKANMILDAMEHYQPNVKAEKFAEAKKQLKIALQYQPENKEARTLYDTIDEREKKTFADMEKAIDEAKWPGHYDNFAGPGDPDQLAASALEWFRKQEKTQKKKKPDHTVAVCVRGDWVSMKRNLLGETIQWGLPVWAACYNKDEKAKDMARVFSLTMLTREEKGVQKAPPWTGVAVGDIYRMRLSHIPAAGGTTSSGSFGRVYRLILALGSILAGIMLAQKFIAGFWPPIKEIVAKISFLHVILGAVLIAVVVLGFLRNLILFFSPIADILPQVFALVAGVLLARNVIVRLLSNPEQEQKPAANPAAAIIDKLKPLQVMIGICCFVFGLLHLIIGGAWLF